MNNQECIEVIKKDFEIAYGSFQLCDIVNQKDHDRLETFLNTKLMELVKIKDKEIAAEKARVQGIVNAWQVAGPVPAYHERAKNALRVNWPTLYYAITNVISSVRT